MSTATAPSTPDLGSVPTDPGSASSDPTPSSPDFGTSELAEAVTPAPGAVAPASFIRRIDSPVGRIEIVSDGDAIVSLAIERDGLLPHDDLDDVPDPVLDRAATQLGEYFAGERHEFDLPVALPGTAFQRAVWEELQKLPWGSVTSYGEIGLATGRPTAGRAVGGAVGANPVPIIIGCHRVLATNKRITGYSAGSGIPTKAWLLDHEGIAHS